MYEYDIAKIKEIPIEEICRSYGLNLKRTGDNLWGRIRNEKTDSFSINPKKNIWRDWGTGEGGSVIDLVMKLENTNEGRAISILGNRFNIPKENIKYSSIISNLPTKSQFKEIGIIYDRSISNFKLDLDKQSIDKLEELEEKYSMNMGELSEKNPKLYHKILDTKSLPIIYNERNSLIDTLSKYKKETSQITRLFFRNQIIEFEESLNSKIDIYNKARLDDINKDNLKINISHKLPDENFTLNNNQVTQYIEEIPNDEIEDIEAVNEWRNILDNNDSLLLKDDVSYYLVHKSAKHENGYQVSLFKDKALTNFNMDMQYPTKYALAKSLAVANEFEIIDSYTLAPIDNIQERKNSLNYEMQSLENEISNLDYRINSYKGKNLKNEISKLKEEVSSKRALYDVKMAEYQGIMDYTNPFIPRKINEPPTTESMLKESEVTIEEPYRYYLTQRPPSIGTHPNGTSNLVAFDNKQEFEGVNCYGYVEYTKPLTKNQIDDYELVEKVRTNNEDLILKEPDNITGTKEIIEREIGDFMEEINNSKIVDFNINKDVDVTEILENLKNGVGNIFNNEKFIQYLNFQSQFYNYSANNNLLISLQNPSATNVASFTKWKSLGRTVNKGEKGIVILAPNYTKNSITDIFSRLDKFNKTFVNKYTFTKNDDKYSIRCNNKIIKNDLSKQELTNFIKLNNLSQTQLLGFKKTYVFDISQTSGEPIPEFKLNKLNDNDLIDSNGYYKNPLIKVELSEGSIYETNKYMTFKQANEIYEKNELKIRELKKEYESKGEYYPYMKQKMNLTYNSNEPISGVKKDLRIDIGDGEYNNLLEALKSETMIVRGEYYNTLQETLASSDNSMETILALKNQLENSIKEKGISLEYTSDTHGANGYFSPSENKICVNDKMSLSATTKTLTHEYVHSQLHSATINPKDNLPSRQVAEIEAEATTYVVSKHFGFDTSEYSFDYVSTWARGKEIKELEQTLKTIKEASEKIINEIKAPFELEVFNTRDKVEEMLKRENIKPNDKMIDNIIDINKETGKLNSISDLKNAEKYKSYADPELNSKISLTNKSIIENVVKIEVIKTARIGLER